MNIEQLKTAWQASVATPASTAVVNRLADHVHRAERHYRRQALARRIYGSSTMALTLALLASVHWLPDGVWPGMRVAITIWALSLIACIIGMWRVRLAQLPRADDTLTDQLTACLQDIRREMAYFRALRWLFWLPFGIGFVFAVSWRVPHGDAPLFLILGTAGLWVWGMLYGPRSMLRRLQPQVDALERMLADAHRDAAPRPEG